MFRDIVSNLSLSPAATGQLTFYWRRLKREQLTRQLSFVMAGALVVLQVATIIAPPDPVAAAGSDNDVVPMHRNDKGNLITGINDPDFKWPKDVTYPCKNGMSQFGQKRYLIYLIATHRYDLESLMTKNNISIDDVCSLGPHKIEPSDSGFNSWLSFGRIKQSESDKQLDAGNSTFFYRPLSQWGPASYPALYGELANGHHIAFLYDCGNLEVTIPPAEGHDTARVVSTTSNVPAEATRPAPAQTATPFAASATPPADTPTPTSDTTTTVPTVATPTALNVPTHTPTAATTPAGTPHITQQKTATLYSNSTKQSGNANGATAQAGDTIEYTLITANDGTAAAAGYVPTDSVTDVLEYADIINPGNGIIANNIISWPATTIPAGGTYVTTFTVKIKNPIPATPVSISDPKSYDLEMDNIYGTMIATKLQAPVAKQIEVAAATLPDTGPSVSSFIVLVLAGSIAFFYYRNRQLLTEVSMLRGDHHGQGGSL